MSKLKLGMVGGGLGAFIGGVHRIAARIDGEWELVAGAFSSDAERSRASGAELGVAPDRVYDSFAEMAEAEAVHPDGIDAVAIVTPNYMHAEPVIAFLKAGIHVICDKPLATTIQDAEAIAMAVEESGKQFVLTHNYSGYPLIRQARDMVKRGDLGEIRIVQVEYAQDWLADEVSNKQADWRTDPARAGGGAIGDIGTHAHQLACFVTGLEVSKLSAELDAFVQGRQVDDNAQVMLRFDGGAKGMLWASQVAVGNENALKLRVYGTKGGIEWAQENPNVLVFSTKDAPKQILTRAGAGATSDGTFATRIPPGHPEGYLEAFATIYKDAAAAIRHVDQGVPIPDGVMFPSISDGMTGMRFIDACLKSSKTDGAWVDLE